MGRSIISADNFANLMGVSKSTLQAWEFNKVYTPHISSDGTKFFYLDELSYIPEIKELINSMWDEEMSTIPSRDFYSIELFAGGGGMALGMELAGFHHVLLNEFDHNACSTLRGNRPGWNIVEGDVCNVDFSKWRGLVDFISGGFPCQAFSFAGKKGGFNDTRGTLFFQLARAIKEVRPKVFLGENVRGLETHDGGKTLEVIKNVISELGYTLVEPKVLKAIKFKVPQKRERLILIGIRNDYANKVKFEWPSPYKRIMTLRDAFYSGELYDSDVPDSAYQKYPEKKQKVLSLVPQGGDWRDLPENIQKEYMGASFYLGGGKTGMARRLSLDEPSLTLTCAPAQKQTERCHPLETRPLTIREYARIQTFPDDWQFAGNLTSQYKQIGNAVPVNLAWAIGRSIIRLLNKIHEIDQSVSLSPTENKEKDILRVKNSYIRQLTLFEPETLYVSNVDEKLLVAPSRIGNRKWILDNMMYNFPISQDVLEANMWLKDVDHVVILKHTRPLGFFKVTKCEIVDKPWLEDHGYPVKSSKRSKYSNYILYHLERTDDGIPNIDMDNFRKVIKD